MLKIFQAKQRVGAELFVTHSSLVGVMKNDTTWATSLEGNLRSDQAAKCSFHRFFQAADVWHIILDGCYIHITMYYHNIIMYLF